MTKSYYYVVKVQYLGFRYHGWQKQPDLKTVHLMIDKTLNFIFDGKQKFKTLGSGRTDAMVSANDAAFELFLNEPLQDSQVFIDRFNYYLPQDIKAISIMEVDDKFNIIQNPKLKEYMYLFAHGQKSHPFCASLMTTFRDQLDIQLMATGARLFEGTHNFKNYCSNATDKGVYEREVIGCELIENTMFQANFFPSQSYILKVIGKGFLYNQIRLMMGTLVKLGRGDINLNYIERSLISGNNEVIDYIAPASGLILNKTDFN
ncbi:tRNA pseudouridine(38-40) synthase TruA [Flavobacteriales bacterium 34_180_T64]|nr:tRNA pseudouridine(38-40) synthase TruA [Flavobacteriales bacterium 34_180_T64]